MAVLALVIRLESPGPVLFRQERVGQHGQPFTLYKFRSMVENAESHGARWAQKNDARVTRIGGFLRRSHLDELPQVWNVLRGDLSFVGPRPERPCFVEVLREQIPFYDLRHYVKPGVTGWAQVCYPYAASIEDSYEKLQYDLYYAKHVSLALGRLHPDPHRHARAHRPRPLSARGESMKNRLQIVGIGGGTGLSILLSGLKRQLARASHDGRLRATDITAIVSVADDGGSTGLLRQSFDIPAVGDLRNCIVALAPGNQMWSRLFQHRFEGDNGLAGHALGNLIMTALVQRSGGLSSAIGQLARALRLRGRVLPGHRGQGHAPRRVRRRRGGERRVADPEPRPPHREAVARAEAQRSGAGRARVAGLGRRPSCSVRAASTPASCPTCWSHGVAEAIRDSQALRIFVCNLMTQPGETDGFDALDHLQVLERYLGTGVIDVCIINGRSTVGRSPSAYDEVGAEEVRWSSAAMARAGVLPIVADLLLPDQYPHRHDPEKLADVVLCLARGLLRCERRADEEEVETVPMPLAAAGPAMGWGRRELRLVGEPS